MTRMVWKVPKRAKLQGKLGQVKTVDDKRAIVFGNC